MLAGLCAVVPTLLCGVRHRKLYVTVNPRVALRPQGLNEVLVAGV